MNIIVVGIISSKNGASWNLVLRDFYAVPRDLRQRVLFDPTAEFVGGLSGGGENSYVFSRFWAQHVSGIFAMSGWMGCTFGFTNDQVQVIYYSTSQVQTNLLVARTTGTSDDQTQLTFLAPDGSFLTSCGAIVQDWTFTGGHTTPPDSVKTACLTWLLSHRTSAGPNDQSNSVVQAADWRSRAATGQSEAVLRECVNTLMNQPRTWFALEAQLVMDDLMTNYNSFRLLSVSNLAQGDFGSDLFYYSARGAANAARAASPALSNRDPQRYAGNLKALTGITGTSGDRAGDIYYMLTNFNYSAPLVQLSAGQTPGQVSLWLQEDAPGISYSVQSRTNLANDVWQGISPPAFDTNTIWSVTFGFDPGSGNGFYRVGTTPLPAASPPWPNGSGGQ